MRFMSVNRMLGTEAACGRDNQTWKEIHVHVDMETMVEASKNAQKRTEVLTTLGLHATILNKLALPSRPISSPQPLRTANRFNNTYNVGAIHL